MGGFSPPHFAPVITASHNAVVSRLVLMFLSSVPNFNQETNVSIQLNKEKEIFAVMLPLSLLHQRNF